MDLQTEYAVRGTVLVYEMSDIFPILKQLDRLLTLPNRERGVADFPAESDRLSVAIDFSGTITDSAVREIEEQLKNLSGLVIGGGKLLIRRDGEEKTLYLGTPRGVQELRSRESLALILQELPNLRPDELEELRSELPAVSG